MSRSGRRPNIDALWYKNNNWRYFQNFSPDASPRNRNIPDPVFCNVGLHCAGFIWVERQSSMRVTNNQRRSSCRSYLSRGGAKEAETLLTPVFCASDRYLRIGGMRKWCSMLNDVRTPWGMAYNYPKWKLMQLKSCSAPVFADGNICSVSFAVYHARVSNMTLKDATLQCTVAEKT